jgi:hypothetical protein
LTGLSDSVFLFGLAHGIIEICRSMLNLTYRVRIPGFCPALAMAGRISSRHSCNI